MKIKTTVQSVEPNIADLANSWLKSYKLPYKLEQLQAWELYIQWLN
jgi:mitochondrial fission protein ELM1